MAAFLSATGCSQAKDKPLVVSSENPASACLIEAENGFVDGNTGKLKPSAGSDVQQRLEFTNVAIAVHRSDGGHVDGNTFTKVAFGGHSGAQRGRTPRGWRHMESCTVLP